MMFSGLMSQWRTLRLWAKARASQIFAKVASMAGSTSGARAGRPTASIQSASVRPSTRLIVKKGLPSPSVPRS